MQSQRSITAEAHTEPIAQQVVEAQLAELAGEIDQIEGYSVPHGNFMAGMAEALGHYFGLRDGDLSSLKQAAFAHDLGERIMNREYFLRRGELTWDERFDMWRHPILGEQAAAQRELSRQAQLLIRWHHEWWNGRGYPDNLAGEAIPLGARILRVTDTYSALISGRPYREPFDDATAKQIVADSAGIEFDPRVVKAFLELATQS
jgi:HD-GYP domain-containing protein (c-di-GMP phosphodiesterase class II)